MIKIKVYTIGKTKESWLKEALAEYEKRLQAGYSIQWFFAKDDSALCQMVEKENHFIALDLEGTLFSSPKLSSFLEKEVTAQGSSLTFLIGGATGIPEKLKQRAEHIISFSPLTFTHQMTRLILLEQLYRGAQIQKGTGYHK